MIKACIKEGTFNLHAEAERNEKSGIGLKRLELKRSCSLLMNNFFSPDKHLYAFSISWQENEVDKIFCPFDYLSYREFKVKYISNNQRWVEFKKNYLTDLNWKDGKINLVIWILECTPGSILEKQDLLMIEEFFKTWKWNDDDQCNGTDKQREDPVQKELNRMELELVNKIKGVSNLYRLLEFSDHKANLHQRDISVKQNQFAEIHLQYI